MIDKSIKGLDLGGYKPKVEVPNLINDLTDGNRVATNEQNITTLQGDVSSQGSAITNLGNEVSTKASVQYVDNKFNGASKAIAYDGYSTMITAFNALADDIYAIGQDVLIQTLQVPDLWVSGIESASVQYTYVDDETFTSELDTNGYVQVGYYKLSALETQKVDLTDYQKKLTAGTNITIDANNVISASGGQKYYVHYLTFTFSSSGSTIGGNLQIVTSQSTKFTRQTLADYLYNNGMNNANDKKLSLAGVSAYSTATEYKTVTSTNVFALSNTVIAILCYFDTITFQNNDLNVVSTSDLISDTRITLKDIVVES